MQKFLLLFILFIIGCLDTTPVVDSKKPYGVVIKKERSYFQAEKIREHLKDEGYDSYIVEKGEGEDHWYHVTTGAFATKEEAENYKSLLEKQKLKPDTILFYEDIPEQEKYFLENPKSRPLEEKKRIPAETPDVPDAVISVTEKIPSSNAFYIGEMSLVYFKNGKKLAKDVKADLPRGIYWSYLAKNGEVFAEVILTDNLYGDKVTFEVLYKKNHEESLAEEIAEKILETDNYEIETKDPFTIRAFRKLNGYKVVLKAKKGVLRTYYISEDELGEFVFITQSTAKNEKEMLELMKLIGKSTGLTEYDEFWNSFYLLPKNLEGDTFLGYAATKLTWRYAKERGYQKWAKSLVGHWQYQMYFITPENEKWSYFVTDDHAKKKAKLDYKNYKTTTDTQKIKVCGIEGRYSSGNFWTLWVSEINYSYDRYILGVSSY